MMMRIKSQQTNALRGLVQLPGDKSISHRALMLAAIGKGFSRITGLNTGEDVKATAEALTALGASFQWRDDLCEVEGKGFFAFKAPSAPLELGNSGTSARLLTGLLVGQRVPATLKGDASLSRRPMARVVNALREMGAKITLSAQGTLPITLGVVPALKGITYTLPVPSAQLKSAVLLAGLTAQGSTRIYEPEKSRDHTERLLTYLELPFTKEGDWLHLEPVNAFLNKDFDIPQDPSAAAFFVVAALITKDSEVTFKNICWNPYRRKVFEVLQEMGGDIKIVSSYSRMGEERVNLCVRSSLLENRDLSASLAPSLIDEYPILAVAAACAQGRAVFRGLGELRYKESNRLKAIAEGLQACGVGCVIEEDCLIIEGCGGQPPGGGRVEAHLDHRIAMSFLTLGLAAQEPIVVNKADTIATSFPQFLQEARSIGCQMTNA